MIIEILCVGWGINLLVTIVGLYGMYIEGTDITINHMLTVVIGGLVPFLTLLFTVSYFIREYSDTVIIRGKEQ